MKEKYLMEATGEGKLTLIDGTVLEGIFNNKGTGKVL